MLHISEVKCAFWEAPLPCCFHEERKNHEREFHTRTKACAVTPIYLCSLEPCWYHCVWISSVSSLLSPPPSSLLLSWKLYILCLWDSPSRNTGVSCRFLLQGIFPIQGMNLCLLHLEVDSLPLAPPRKCMPLGWILCKMNLVILIFGLPRWR